MERGLKALVIALFIAPAYAGVLPSADDLPIIRSDDPRYSQAAVNFQKALFLQTGITADYNLLTNYFNNKIDQFGRQRTEDLQSFLDHETFLPSKYVFGAAGLLYTVGVKKHVTQKFRDPLFPVVEHTFDVGIDGASTTIKIPF